MENGFEQQDSAATTPMHILDFGIFLQACYLKNTGFGFCPFNGGSWNLLNGEETAWLAALSCCFPLGPPLSAYTQTGHLPARYLAPGTWRVANKAFERRIQTSPCFCVSSMASSVCECDTNRISWPHCWSPRWLLDPDAHLPEHLPEPRQRPQLRFLPSHTHRNAQPAFSSRSHVFFSNSNSPVVP